MESCSEYLLRFGGHRAAAGLELRADQLEPFRRAFATHATEILGSEEQRRVERIDATVGGASLGLDLAEELGRLAPFGNGNPGVRLLVPAARLSDVRTMGEGAKHSRFNLHSGSHRALGVAFGRAKLGVGEDEQVDATVRLELNHWNGSVEPRVVLGEVYPHPGGEEAKADGAGEDWWERFECELVADLYQQPTSLVRPDGEPQREIIRGLNSPAATVFELLSSGAEVLALVADVPRRAGLARPDLALADYAELLRHPDLARDFDHVVLLDPPPSAQLDLLASRSGRAGTYLHPVWGEAELRFLFVLGLIHPQRSELAGVFRCLREAGEIGGDQLRDALRGDGPYPRSAEVAARCFRVLADLDLLRGAACGGAGTVEWAVSSGETKLERSAAFRAYRARYEEGKRFLEGLKQT